MVESSSPGWSEPPSSSGSNSSSDEQEEEQQQQQHSNQGSSVNNDVSDAERPRPRRKTPVLVDQTPPSARTRRQLGQQLAVAEQNAASSAAGGDTPRSSSRREMPFRGGSGVRGDEGKLSPYRTEEDAAAGAAGGIGGGVTRELRSHSHNSAEAGSLEAGADATPTRQTRSTAKKSSARGARPASTSTITNNNMQVVKDEQVNSDVDRGGGDDDDDGGSGSGVADQDASGTPTHNSRPSGPLSSAHGERRVLNSRRDKMNSVAARQRAMLTASDLPFAAPTPYKGFPSFKGCARYDGFYKQQEPQQFFDCKFYPYGKPGDDAVLATVGGTKIIVARPDAPGGELLDVLMWLEEESDELPKEALPYQLPESNNQRNGRRATGKASGGASSTSMSRDKVELNSCVWLRDPRQDLPILAVSGKPSSIKLYDVTNKRLDRTFIGHGKEVNDLAVSPKNPSILASASGDRTVRFWSLDPRFEKQPCIAMCAGEGHRQGLLTLAFHGRGNYILTGGVDNAVCLWALPPLPDERSNTDEPTMVHYPHFKSTAIHMSFVDCVAFHGDLILSKAAIENKIVLWRIEGFDSRDPSPPKAPVESNGATSSAFGGKYQRLVQFKADDMTSFYIRFSLFSYPGQRTILAVGNEKSKVLFWDLDALDEFTAQQDSYYDLVATNGVGAIMVSNRGGRPAKRKGKSRRGGAGDSRQESILSESSNAKSDSLHGAMASGLSNLGVTGSSKQKLDEKYRMNDPFVTLIPHKISSVQKVSFACRQVAWSVGGDYMAVVGDQGMIGLFGRDMVWPEGTHA